MFFNFMYVTFQTRYDRKLVYLFSIALFEIGSVSTCIGQTAAYYHRP
jgi:hypothetical protein